jgi:phage-related minor tail protein
MILVGRNSRYGGEGRVDGVQRKAQGAAIAEAVASICNAAMRVVGAAGTSELAGTVHYKGFPEGTRAAPG